MQLVASPCRLNVGGLRCGTDGWSSDTGRYCHVMVEGSLVTCLLTPPSAAPSLAPYCAVALSAERLHADRAVSQAWSNNIPALDAAFANNRAFGGRATPSDYPPTAIYLAYLEGFPRP